ncbi:phosphoenolpyruvate--protein phosphotransferase [Sulfuriroseicoccus oceanibius]|uniref:Phosphoenolpyruvate-protein phosphotransferase n=1 Tax=Sulfuriroseicoccus oceanibius TaxID=2707525 RepID=A0A6B3L8V5_9BACT|nr:phosphoenolpyruvate--protein phosphotransferase [Sulfuriroseicoccus oceanibius]QQL44179.1 phosphoenolpyruvate--protein phosphotransferase [Sulfuriroseicoccus oceanibius]
MKKLHEERTTPISLRAERRYQGVGLSDGIAQGEVLTLYRGVSIPPKVRISDDQKARELERLGEALEKTRQDLDALRTRIEEAGGGREAGIFDAHLMILEDRMILDDVEKAVRERNVSADWAFYQVTKRYVEAMDAIPDEFLRERMGDVKDVAQRVLRHMLGEGTPLVMRELSRPHIIAARELTPSDTAAMDRDLVLGFLNETGSQTSHAAIIARSLGLPAIAGIPDLTDEISSGEEVLIDGYRGLVVVNPSQETLDEYERIIERHAQTLGGLKGEVGKPTDTIDGKHIVLSGNIEFKREMAMITENGGAGVGLFRTEFFYLRDNALPTEAEQAQTYAEVAAACEEHGVIIRTFDLGGDKLPNSPFDGPEPNPFLGWRGIRVSLGRPEVFKTQLRAILRASAHGKIRIMFPMVASPEEVVQAKQILEAAKAELIDEELPFDENIEVGAMIEIPSAALVADLIAPHVDFFSVGTNDLTQYTLAVDRVNDRVAPLFRSTHTGVVRLLQHVVKAAHDAGIWVGVCGETAGDPTFTPLLVGMGVDELSVGPRQILTIRHAIRQLDSSECAKLVQRLVAGASTDRIEEDCRAMAMRCYPELLS